MYEAKQMRIGVTGWALVYVNRLLRILPVYGFILMAYSKVVPAMGSGPLWWNFSQHIT